MRPVLCVFLSAVACTPSGDLGSAAGTGTAPPGGANTGSPPDTGPPDAPSSDASLVSLNLATVPLQPPFASDILHYATRADGTVRVQAVPTVPDAVVELVHTTVDGRPLARFGPEADISLASGERVLAEVTAPDGQATSTYAVTLLPDGVPELDVWSDGASPGYFLFANLSWEEQPDNIGWYLLVVDERGTPVWYRELVQPAFDFRGGPDGRLTYVGVPPGGDAMLGVVLGRDRELERTIRPLDSPGVDVHEFMLLDDGHAILLGLDVHREDLSPWGFGDDVEVIDQVAQELGPGDSLVRSWSTRGEVDLEALPEFWDQLIAGGSFEPAHLNSVDIDPADGGWVMSLRIPSQVVKVDAQGERLWTLGGTQSDFTFVGDDRDLGFDGFAWQHSARVTGPNRVMVFDNAINVDLGDTGPTRYAEYQLDLEASTATLVSSWELAGSGSTDAAGSVQRMDDGHVVVGFGSLDEVQGGMAPDIVELDEDHNVVFELRMPAGQWSYRAWKIDAADWDR